MTSIIIGKEITRVGAELCRSYLGFSSPVLADVSKTACGLDFAIKPIKHGLRLAGPAVTVELGFESNLLLHKALEIAEPGDVLVVDHGGNTARSVFGEIMSTVAQKKGIAGLVVDGLIRDLARCQELGFPIFARGAHPVVCGRQGNPGSINLPIRCGGVAVHPGDLVFGDEDGLVVVPRERAESIADDARKKIAAEDARLQDIENGELFPSWLESAFDDIPTTYLASPGRDELARPPEVDPG